MKTILNKRNGRFCGTAHPHVYFFSIPDFEIPDHSISLQPVKEVFPRGTLLFRQVVFSHWGVAPTIGVTIVACVAVLVFGDKHGGILYHIQGKLLLWSWSARISTRSC